MDGTGKPRRPVAAGKQLAARHKPRANEGAARLFIGLWPDPEARRALADWEARVRWPRGAAVVVPERLHLTLHFLGLVAQARIPALREGLRVPCAPIALEFGDVHQWAQGLVVLCPRGTSPALVDLHTALAEVLRALGHPVEQRPFAPHVTLARRASGAVLPAAAPSLRWVSSGYALIRSVDGYHEVARYAAEDPQLPLPSPPPG